MQTLLMIHQHFTVARDEDTENLILTGSNELFDIDHPDYDQALAWFRDAGYRSIVEQGVLLAGAACLNYFILAR